MILNKSKEGFLKNADFNILRNNLGFYFKATLLLDTELEEICFELGNTVAAIDSVPTALFCFLR